METGTIIFVHIITFIVCFIIGFNFDEIIRFFKSLKKKRKRILCTKDLFLLTGEKCFTKNNKYEVTLIRKINGEVDYLILINDAHEEHYVYKGSWLEHFRYKDLLTKNYEF